MNIREMFKQVARQVIDKLSNIALAVKLHLGATPEATRPAMAMAAPAGLNLGFGSSSGGARSRPGLRRATRTEDETR